MEAGRQEEEMTKVLLFDQNDTNFATFDMPELPRMDDTIEIGFPDEQVVKTFVVERVVHKMIQLPEYISPPWFWEVQLHGYLDDSKETLAKNWANIKCVCAQGITKCPKHGDQPAERETCPLCKKAVLGYCAQGEYCTSEDCEYAA
jgi:hypothetical protein